MTHRGQALIESIPFFMLLFGLMGIVWTFTQWFLIHQKLLLAAREGALLYSSGHHTKSEVERKLRAYLEAGSLPLEHRRLQIDIGRAPVPQAFIFQLDEVKIRFTPTSSLQRYFQNPLEEKCIIKHVPSYGLPSQPLYGPPVPW